MYLAELWLPIIGGAIFIAWAIAAWYGDNKYLSVWLAFFGFVCFMLLGVFQVQEWLSENEAIHIDPDRPYVSVIALGIPGGVLKPGPLVIFWPIKNDGRKPTTIMDANMSVWYETEERPLPPEPKYIPNTNKLKGLILSIGNPFNVTFRADNPLSAEAIDKINKGDIRLFVYGYVKYGTSYEYRFIGKYSPTNDPGIGMFSNVDNEYPSYSRNE